MTQETGNVDVFFIDKGKPQVQPQGMIHGHHGNKFLLILVYNIFRKNYIL